MFSLLLTFLQPWAADLIKEPPALPGEVSAADRREEKEVTLRVCNWEEYIDLGDWDEEETIDLDSGDVIGENSMLEDFE